MREGWIIGGATVAACLVGAGALYWAGPPRRLAGESLGPSPTLADARAFAASQPEFFRAFPATPTPQGLADLRAESCGVCHREIYAEWRVSTHARAWLDDAQFQAELHKNDGKPGQDTTWICLNCHTPLENQLRQLVVGLEEGHLGKPRRIDNPEFDPRLQLEAVTCAVCHVRDGVVLGPYGADGAPHPVRKAPELLASELCTRCHQAAANFPVVELACAFTTGEEVAAGPHAGETCQSCHMPEVERSLTSLGTPVRTTRRHWFGGSLIPKRPEDEADLAPLRAHYPDGVSLAWAELPQTVSPGQETQLRFVAHNDAAGHKVPTGDPERYLLLEAKVLDAEGKVLVTRTERIGSVYQWSPFQLLSDNRLAPAEAREFELSFVAPQTGPLTLVLEASKHRISPENLAYHELEGKTVPARVYFQAERRLEVSPR